MRRNRSGRLYDGGNGLSGQKKGDCAALGSGCATNRIDEGAEMSKLVLKFESSVLKEVAVGTKEVSIGRSPECGIVIDNPAVSNYHARVVSEEGRMMLEDFGSLNGTFVNGQRVKMVSLKPGDSIAIGKHTITVWQSEEGAEFVAGGDPSRPAPPKIAETVVLDTKERR